MNHCHWYHDLPSDVLYLQTDRIIDFWQSIRLQTSRTMYLVVESSSICCNKWWENNMKWLWIVGSDNQYHLNACCRTFLPLLLLFNCDHEGGDGFRKCTGRHDEFVKLWYCAHERILVNGWFRLIYMVLDCCICPGSKCCVRCLDACHMKQLALVPFACDTQVLLSTSTTSACPSWDVFILYYVLILGSGVFIWYKSH